MRFKNDKGLSPLFHRWPKQFFFVASFTCIRKSHEITFFSAFDIYLANKHHSPHQIQFVRTERSRQENKLCFFLFIYASQLLIFVQRHFINMRNIFRSIFNTKQQFLTIISINSSSNSSRLIVCVAKKRRSSVVYRYSHLQFSLTD